MNQRILVIGGAGYIGSHMVRTLSDNGLQPLVLDNLSSGHAAAVSPHELIVGDAGDAELLDTIFTSYPVAGVMHFASSIQVGESVMDPGKYYDNNVSRTITLLNAMVKRRVGPFIFSSTAAIFGNPDYTPIDEAHAARPINPYGASKWMVERLLEDYGRAYGLRYGCLRYFNAAGAHPDGTIGECHEPETHLIPLVLQAASGRRPHITIFGEDYPTPDGTCIRDYIHVCDLADAHLLLLRALQGGLEEGRFNLGLGRGYSVAEVIAAARRVTGVRIATRSEGRRAGDPAVLIADGSAMRGLGWQPRFAGLEQMITHAWGWEQRLAARRAA